MKRKRRKKNCSSYNNEKISDYARVSEFCVTNLTIGIERIETNEKKEMKERKTVLLIIMKKYPTMRESLDFVSQIERLVLKELKRMKRKK